MPGGRWTVHILLAHQKNWPPHWVDQADPEYIAELMTFLNAEGEHNLAESELTPEQRKAKQQHREIARKLKIMDRNEKRGSKR